MANGSVAAQQTSGPRRHAGMRPRAAAPRRAVRGPLPPLPIVERSCYPPAATARASAAARRAPTSRFNGEPVISRDLRINQMIRVPQVRVLDEDGSQLGVMPTPQALAMAQERGLDFVEVAPTAAPPVVRFLDYGQYKYELTKREKEAKRKQRAVEFKEVRLTPKIGIGRLRDEGPPRDRVPRGRGPDQGDRPLPRPGAHASGDRPEPARQVRRAGEGPRHRGPLAGARRQVDVHDARLGPQAEDARAPPPAGKPEGAPSVEPAAHRRRTDRRPPVDAAERRTGSRHRHGGVACQRRARRAGRVRTATAESPASAERAEPVESATAPTPSAKPAVEAAPAGE